MVLLTENECKMMLILFKDFDSHHNASSVAKLLNISRVGAMKILKIIEGQGLLKSNKIGNSIIYKINLDDDYARKLISFLLADEANKHKRWKDEFVKLFKNDRIIILFGSTTRDYAKANDIDLLAAIKAGEYAEVESAIKEQQKILRKKIHPLIMSKYDFIKNIKEKSGAMPEIIKTGIVLYGEDEYVEVMKHVTSS